MNAALEELYVARQRREDRGDGGGEGVTGMPEVLAAASW
jgi:hypothetical protein